MSVRIISASPHMCVHAREQSDIGECRRTAKRLAEQFNFDEETAGRVSIVATELATNAVRHGGGGELLIQVLNGGSTPQLEMLAIDRGRGMSDVERCMRDGYSTAGTPGTGLGAVSRLSDTFDVFSAPDKGTVVLSRIGLKSEAAKPAAAGRQLEFGAVCIAIAGESNAAILGGSPTAARPSPFLVTDGLGHGLARRRGISNGCDSLQRTAVRRAVGGYGESASCLGGQPRRGRGLRAIACGRGEGGLWRRG